MKGCKDCTERTETCHANCIAYKIWLDGFYKQKSEKRKLMQNKRDLDAYCLKKSAMFGHMREVSRRKNEI